MRRVLILGATSAIAGAVARRFAADGDRLYLVGRDAERLGHAAEALRRAGAEQALQAVEDLCRLDRHAGAIAAAREALGAIDVALIAHGVLPDQRTCERDFAAIERHLTTNFVSAASLATGLAEVFETQRGGTLAIITSVAGERGRRGNYVYGAAKAGLSVFADGLRQRLTRAGARVLIVKPGFVDTPMTAGLRKGLLWATPDRVGRSIQRAIVSGRSGAIYVPWFWRPLMAALRLLPRFVFDRLPL